MVNPTCELCALEFNSYNEALTIESAYVGLPYTICMECAMAAAHALEVNQ